MRNLGKYAAVIRFGPILLFLVALVIRSQLSTDGSEQDVHQRRLSESDDKSCSQRIKKKYDCDDEDCSDLVSGLVNYLYMSYCNFGDYQWAGYFVTIPWLLYLLYLLADTADNFFVPVLEHMVEFGNVPPSIAGITFLSFGNGAPDVFSAVVSYASGSGGDIGFGALLGSGAYVTCIICAVIAFTAPEGKGTLYRRPFLRDVGFYLLTLVYMLVLYITQADVTIYLALGFVVLYFCYMLFVVVARHVYQSTKSKSAYAVVEEGKDEEADGGSRDGLASETEQPADSWGYCGYNEYVKHTTVHHQHPHEISHEGAVEFMRLLAAGTPSHRVAAAYADRKIRRPMSEAHRNTLKRHQSWSPHSPFTAKTNRHMSGIEVRTVQKALSQFGELPIKNLAPEKASGMLKEPLLPDESKQPAPSTEAGSPMTNSTSAATSGVGAPGVSDVPVTADDEPGAPRTLRGWIITWMEKFGEQPWYEKILTALLMPSLCARVLSIPLASEDDWNSQVVVLTPILGMAVLSLVLGPSTFIGPIPLAGMMVVAGFGLSAVLFFALRGCEKKPPKSCGLLSLLIALGFVMAIVWIYLIANEIVTILQTLGAQLDISDTALGLTVLAWANSAPDTISISAVAREGNVQMAIGGVYAGRMFDTAMGLGLGLAIAAAQGDSNPLGNDDTAIVSFTTLFLSVGAAAVVVPMSGYKYSKFFGYSLIGLYLVFLPLALMISFGLF